MDVEGAVEDQWGKPQDIADMINAISEYRTSNPNDIIQIGDMRSPSNNVVNMTTTRTHHANNGAFDIRLLGDQGTLPAVNTINSLNFSSVRTQQFVDALGNNNFSRFLIGPNAVEDICGTGTCTIYNGGNSHNNHYHVDKD